jgi:KDO2-lipid IV(A) lauroyltransferase
VLYVIRSIERSVRRHLTRDLNRQRFDRAKQFVDELKGRAGGAEVKLVAHARWLKFLCGRRGVQDHLWPEETAFLRDFATLFGLPPAERRQFIGLSLLGLLWRDWCFDALRKGPPELVARLTSVSGWEHFDRCRRDGAGLILLPIHGQFSRLFQPYLRHRGYDALEVGLTNDRLEFRGFLTPAAKRFELARQMHAAKHLLARGGIACNLPDARQNLDNSRSVEFFGRQRQVATGFAELALATGAHVLPIAYRFSPRGIFTMEFGAPLHVPGPESAHEERVDSLVAQYANFLRDEWRRYPWNVHWGHLRYYCKLPAVGADSLQEQANVISPPDGASHDAREGIAR